MASVIGEAFVAVRPDLSGFQAQLQKELQQAIASTNVKPVTVKAKVVADSSGDSVKAVAAKASRTAKASADAAGNAAETATKKVTKYDIAVRRLAEATKFLATSAVAGEGATTKQAAAEARAAAASQALAASKTALSAAIKANNNDLIKQATLLFENARAAEVASKKALAPVKTTVNASLSEAQIAADVAAEKALKGRALATSKLVIAEEALAKVSKAGDAARTKFTAASNVERAARAAVNSAVKAETAALKTQNVELIANAAFHLKDAQAAEINAKDQLKLAAANAAATARTSQATRGAFAAGAGFAGLRGAVLAATGPFLAATVAVTALGKAISGAANVEEQLNVFQVTAQATGAEMEKVSAAARALGKDITLPGVSSADAAVAFTELAKAGLSVQDSIDGARGVLLLATAASIDFSSASELVASALNSFGLAGDQAGRVADVFAGAANAAQGSIEDFALANQQVDAVARQVGFTLEDTTAILAELAKNGLRGSDAGTSLRTALIRLVAPTTEARDLLADLGVSIRDAQGNIDPLVFARFGEATANLAPDLRDAITATIFGQDAIRAVAIAAREGEDGFNRMSDAVNRVGSAQEQADARSKGLKGAIGGLTSNLETFGTTIASVALPPLEVFVTTLSGVVGAAAEAGAALIDLGGQVKDFVQNLPGAGTAGDVFKGFLKFTGPQAAFFGVKAAVDAFTGSEKEATDQADQLSKGLSGFIDRAQQLGRSQFAPTFGFQDAIDQVKKITTRANQLEATLSTFGQNKEITDAVRDSVLTITDELESIGGPQVQAVLRKNAKGLADVFASVFRQQAGDFGVEIENLNAKVPDALKRTIDKLAQSAPGRAQLRQIGKQLADEIAAGIEDSQAPIAAAQKQVDNAAKAVEKAQASLGKAIVRGNQSIADAIEASNDALDKAVQQSTDNFIQSVVQARSNLDSFAGGISDSVSKLIDVGPFKQQADKLQAELDKVNRALDAFQEKNSRRQLGNDLANAQKDLANAQKQFRLLGTPSAAQRNQIDQALNPLVQRVDDARAALQEFNLQDKADTISAKIAGIEDLKQKAQDAAKNGIDTLVQAFRNGNLSADNFAAKIRAQLEPQLKTLRSKSGKNLGLSFSQGFLSDIDNLVQQAQVLAGFLGVQVPSSVVDPAKVRAEGRGNVADTRTSGADAVAEARSAAAEGAASAREALQVARDNLAESRQRLGEVSIASTETAKNTLDTVNLLKAIKTALAPAKVRPTQKTGGAPPDKAPQVTGGKVKPS